MRKPTRLGSLALSLLAVPAVVCPSSSCRADWLYFARGGRVQAPARREGGRVTIEIPTGRYSFPEQDFRKIVTGGRPENEWVARRDAASRSGAADRFAAAWWALEHGLVSESVAMLRLSHSADPTHQPTARLIATLDRLDRPCDEPRTEALQRALGVSCEEERGPHLVLLHQQEPTEARARVDLLERVLTTYYLVLAGQGLELAVPGRRLVAVHLRNQSDYLAFLESQGAGAFRSTLGYFHPNFRAVLTFEPGTAGPSRPGRGRDSNGDLERRRLLGDLERLARTDGTAAHEFIHLLVIESGLAPEPGAFPLWLHEGLAAQFEVIRGGRWAGIGRAHDLRLPDWRSLNAPPSLESLIRDQGFGHGYRGDLYAKSWALVYFLRKTRPREFAHFVDLLRLPDPDRRDADPARFESRFQIAFGADRAALERDWHAFMASVLTPLEEHDRSEWTGSRTEPSIRSDDEGD